MHGNVAFFVEISFTYKRRMILLIDKVIRKESLVNKLERWIFSMLRTWGKDKMTIPNGDRTNDLPHCSILFTGNVYPSKPKIDGVV